MREPTGESVDLNSKYKERGILQFHFEQESLAKMFGKKWSERWKIASTGLFKEYGSGYVNYRTATNKDFPDPELVIKVYLPKFEEIIDKAYNDTDQNFGLRQGVVNYVLGILMHPAKDGNGQRMRVISLSYIHENSPKYRKNYFPIKYKDDTSYTPIGAWDREIVYSLPPIYPDLGTMSDNERAIFNAYLHLVKAEAERFSFLSRDPKNSVAIGTIYESENVQKALELANMNLTDLSDYDKNQPMKSIISSIGKMLSARFPGFVFDYFRTDSVRNSQFLSFALLTPQGNEIINQYLLHGTTEGNENLQSNHAIVLRNLFQLVEHQFASVLETETKQLHQTKFEKEKDSE